MLREVTNYRNLLLLCLVCFVISPYPLHATITVQHVQRSESCVTPEAISRSIGMGVNSLTLNQALLVSCPAIQQFIADRLRGNKLFQDLFFDIIRSSRNDQLGETVAVAAANAAAILNTANISFTGKDLSGVHIPMADLSQGVFDGTKFCGADLTGVSFQGSWLDNTDFSCTLMKDVNFGERPYLKFQHIVRACCYSKDGRWLAVASGELILLYDTDTFEKIKTLEEDLDSEDDLPEYDRVYGPDGQERAPDWVPPWKEVTNIVFSLTGRQLISTSADRVCFWDCLLGQQITSLTLEKDSNRIDYVSSNLASSFIKHQVAWSIDEKILLLNYENLVHANSSDDFLADDSDGESDCPFGLETLAGHSDKVSCVAFHPSLQHLISGSCDKTLCLWDCETGLMLKKFEGHNDKILGVAFSPSGQEFVSSSLDGALHIWNCAANQIFRIFQKCIFSLRNTVFSSTGQQLASVSLFDNLLRLWDVQTGRMLRTVEGHTGLINSIAFSPDGNQLATGGADKIVRLWDCKTSQISQKFDGHTDWIRSIAFSRSGKQLATSGPDKTIHLWDCETGDILKIFKGHTNYINSVAFSPSEQQVVSGSGDKTLRLWDCKAGQQQLPSFEGHSDYIASVAFHPFKQQVVSASGDSTLHLWDCRTGQVLKKFEGHSGAVSSVAFSPDGHQVASGGKADNTLRLWSYTTGETIKIFVGHTDQVRSVTFSPNGHQIASGSNDKTLRLWDCETGLLCKKFEGHLGAVRDIVFAPSGERLASYDNNFVYLWDCVAGKQIVAIRSTYEISAVNWSRCNHIVTGGYQVISYWKVVEQQGHMPYLQLLWSSHQASLSANNTNLTGVKALSDNNVKLLKQHGAIIPLEVQDYVGVAC